MPRLANVLHEEAHRAGWRAVAGACVLDLARREAPWREPQISSSPAPRGGCGWRRNLPSGGWPGPLPDAPTARGARHSGATGRRRGGRGWGRRGVRHPAGRRSAPGAPPRAGSPPPSFGAARAWGFMPCMPCRAGRSARGRGAGGGVRPVGVRAGTGYASRAMSASLIPPVGGGGHPMDAPPSALSSTPRPAGHLVHRARLIDRLPRTPPAANSCSISAPAGYGKSALCRRVAARRGAPGPLGIA